MSTPRAETVLAKAKAGAAITRAALRADELVAVLQEVFPELDRDYDFISGEMRAVEKGLRPIVEEWRETGALYSRVAASEAKSRAAAAHMNALNLVDEWNADELPEGASGVAVIGSEYPVDGGGWEYKGELAVWGDLPPDPGRGWQRVYSIADPACVAIERDGEWVKVREVP